MFKLKKHVTSEMLESVGFYKTPLQHYRFDVNNNHHVLVDKNTRKISAVKYDFKLLKLIEIESDKLQDLIDKGWTKEVL